MEEQNRVGVWETCCRCALCCPSSRGASSRCRWIPCNPHWVLACSQHWRSRGGLPFCCAAPARASSCFCTAIRCCMNETAARPEQCQEWVKSFKTSCNNPHNNPLCNTQTAGSHFLAHLQHYFHHYFWLFCTISRLFHKLFWDHFPPFSTLKNHYFCHYFWHSQAISGQLNCPKSQKLPGQFALNANEVHFVEELSWRDQENLEEHCGELVIVH